MTDYREHDPDLLNPDELPTFETRSVQTRGGLGPGSVHDHLVKARQAGWADAVAAVQPLLSRKEAQIAAQAKTIHELSERLEKLTERT